MSICASITLRLVLKVRRDKRLLALEFSKSTLRAPSKHSETIIKDSCQIISLSIEME
jgi:hypothetical protein